MMNSAISKKNEAQNPFKNPGMFSIQYDLSPKDISAQSYLQGSVYAL